MRRIPASAASRDDLVEIGGIGLVLGLPETFGNLDRIDAMPGPPGPFITGSVELAKPIDRSDLALIRSWHYRSFQTPTPEAVQNGLAGKRMAQRGFGSARPSTFGSAGKVLVEAP
jgi:hypothetical protein